jgi:hypothetical protein
LLRALTCPIWTRTALTVQALAQVGITAEAVIWEDPASLWSANDLVLIRCTWDYALRRDAFIDWAGALPRVANPASVLAWNTDKRYLGELALDRSSCNRAVTDNSPFSWRETPIWENRQNGRTRRIAAPGKHRQRRR